MTFARWTIAEDAAEMHEHHHPNEEVWNVVGGQIVLVVDGEQRLLRTGSAAVVPPDVAHSVKIVVAAEVVVTDHPVRSDLPGVERASVGIDG